MRCLRGCCSLLLLLSLGLSGTVQAADRPVSGAVSGPEAHALMKSLGDKLLVLDVRTREEFAQGHVPGALLIPVQELESRLAEIPTDRPILILCRTGRRAAAAYDMLSKARPEAAAVGLWYLNATPEYKPDGTFIFP